MNVAGKISGSYISVSPFNVELVSPGRRPSLTRVKVTRVIRLGVLVRCRKYVTGTIMIDVIGGAQRVPGINPLEMSATAVGLIGIKAGHCAPRDN